MDPITRTCVCPAGESMWLKRAGNDKCGNEKLFFMGRLSKCRRCSLSRQCMRHPESANSRLGSGRQVSFVIKACEHKSESVDWMKARIDSAEGKERYAQRMAVVEPVFGNIRSNKGLNRFSLRGKEKVDGQWHLFSLVHNIEKLKYCTSVMEMASRG